MMNTAQFEFLLKTMFKKLLDGRLANWEACKKESADRMTELGAYFGGEKELTRVGKNATLQAWFQQLSEKIKGLDFNNPVLAGRTITQLIQALEVFVHSSSHIVKSSNDYHTHRSYNTCLSTID